LFRRILLIALLAGTAAGLFFSAIQAFRLTPLILVAETFEDAAPAMHDHGDGAHAHQPEWKPSDGRERVAYTLLFNILAGVGFALVLNAALTLWQAAGHAPNIIHGIAWGLAGFASFALAPAMGLSPELPGMPAADLVLRQTWWIGTMLATVVGIVLCVWAHESPDRRHAKIILGLVLMAAPHFIGAPAPAEEASAVPAALAVRFAVNSLATAALFWLVLGALSGWLQRRLS
jgi:cobalt transporter subunit CbtA